MHDDVINAIAKIFDSIRELKNANDLLKKACEKCVQELMKRHDLAKEEVMKKFCASCKVSRLRKMLNDIPYAKLFEILRELLSDIKERWCREFDELIEQLERIRSTLNT